MFVKVIQLEIMKIHRQIIDIKEHSVNIRLPKHIKNGKAELIMLPLEEERKHSIKPSDFVGCISKETAAEMLISTQQSREEWVRNI